MNLYGLIGFPLSHSFSKKYFTDKFAKEELQDYQYELFPLASIDLVSELIQHNPMLKGLNVTIPYKQSVIPFLNDSSHLPAGLDACNCIKIDGGKTYGFNTDILGFENALLPNLKPYHSKALILGNGGAAAAVKYVLRRNNIAFSMVSRSVNEDTSFSYTDLNERIVSEHTIIINTTPLGMYPYSDTFPDLPYEFIGPMHHLFDLVYNPEKSVFLQKGEEKGASIQNGQEMLILQAEESRKIWQND